jgi:hypothetical protein
MRRRLVALYHAFEIHFCVRAEGTTANGSTGVAESAVVCNPFTSAHRKVTD